MTFGCIGFSSDDSLQPHTDKNLCCKPEDLFSHLLLKNVAGIQESRLWMILNRLGWALIHASYKNRPQTMASPRKHFNNSNGKTYRSILSLEASLRHYKGSRGQWDGYSWPCGLEVHKCTSTAASHKVCHYLGRPTHAETQGCSLLEGEGHQLYFSE